MTRTHKRRLVVTIFILLLGAAGIVAQQDFSSFLPNAQPASEAAQSTFAQLNKLEVKGRAPKTGYMRSQFGDGWAMVAGCDMRNVILARDLMDDHVSADCKVVSGKLHDPYTGKTIAFKRGANTSSLVQIDHVVSLSDAWQKGAQQLTYLQREMLANDPLNLLAVDGVANQQKSDGDAATWLPPNVSFRCDYVTRQIKVKVKYHLWVTSAEKQAMERVIAHC